MPSVTSLFSRLKRYLPLAGGTMDAGAILAFPSVLADKIRLYGTTYGIAVVGNKIILYTAGGASPELREDSPAGTVKGTFWHSGNDGSGSGLDADLVKGVTTAEAVTVSTIPVRNSAGDIFARTYRSSLANDDGSSLASGVAVGFRVDTGSNSFLRFATRADLITWLQAGGLGTMTAAHYTANCGGAGTTTNVTITSVTTTAAYIVPACGMVEPSQTGISRIRFSSSTNVVVTHSSGYAGAYQFSVIS